MLKGLRTPRLRSSSWITCFSLEGQKVFLDAYVRPIRADELDLPEEFPAQSAYDATQFTVDQVELVDKRGGSSTDRRRRGYRRVLNRWPTTTGSPLSALRTRAYRLVYPRTEVDREHRRVVALCLPFFLLATVAAFLPMATMARASVSVGVYENVGWTGEFYRTLVSDPVYREIAVNTLWFAAATTLVSVAVGVGVATRWKYDLPFRRGLVAALSFPIALPGIVVAFLIVVLIGRSGLVTNALAALVGGDPFSLATATTVFGLFLAYLYSLIPRSALVLRGTYSEVNQDAEEANSVARCEPAANVLSRYPPQIRPGIVASFILTFRTALTIFGTVLVLQNLNLATLRIHHEIANGFEVQTAAAIGVIYFAFMLRVHLPRVAVHQRGGDDHMTDGTDAAELRTDGGTTTGSRTVLGRFDPERGLRPARSSWAPSP